MWKLACVKPAFVSDMPVEVVVYDSIGAQQQMYASKHRKVEDRLAEVKSLYDQAIANLLKEGWEPFSINGERNHPEVWFRMKVEE